MGTISKKKNIRDLVPLLQLPSADFSEPIQLKCLTTSGKVNRVKESPVHIYIGGLQNVNPCRKKTKLKKGNKLNHVGGLLSV